MSQKSYDEKNKVFIVPTPIGNLEDITYRAIKVLSDVDIIFSEDTRETALILNHFNIKKTMISSHKFNEEKSVVKMLEALKSGKNIAIVSDRGTPLISDPGNICVRRVLEEGYSVVSLPGATALIPAITASGLDCDRFLFYGFLNSKSSKRVKELKEIRMLKNTIVFYEAPHRVLDTLKDIDLVFGNRNVSISREISKKHEEIYRGRLREIVEEIKEPRGEYVIVIEGSMEEYDYRDISLAEHINLYRQQGYDEKTSMKLVSKDRGISKSQIYKEIKIIPKK